MKFSLRQQRGAVLAFSLVMLTLLTLAGTSMIQQNKQQLSMAVNTREQTQQFANAEAVLAEANNIINGYGDATRGIPVDLAHNNCLPTDPNPCTNNYFPTDSKLSIYDPNHQCTPLMPSYTQQIGLAGPVTGVDGATILSVSCLSTQCTSYDTTTKKLTCHPASGDVDCTGKSIAYVAALFSDSNDICYQSYDPLCMEDVNTTKNPRCMSNPPATLPAPQCPKEVYKVDAISSENGATREIISDHVIGCGT